MPRKQLTRREADLCSMLKRMVHYAACLEQECAALGNGAFVDPKNRSLEPARNLLAQVAARR